MFPKDIQILLVDDMPSIRGSVRSILNELGYQYIYESDQGVDAYDFLLSRENSHKPIDLVISDWNMPIMNGLELLKKIRTSLIYKTMPVILLTTEAERDLVTEAIINGVSQYIIKPFNKKIIEDKLKSTYQKHFKKE